MRVNERPQKGHTQERGNPHRQGTQYMRSDDGAYGKRMALGCGQCRERRKVEEDCRHQDSRPTPDASPPRFANSRVTAISQPAALSQNENTFDHKKTAKRYLLTMLRQPASSSSNSLADFFPFSLSLTYSTAESIGMRVFRESL